MLASCELSCECVWRVPSHCCPALRCCASASSHISCGILLVLYWVLYWILSYWYAAAAVYITCHSSPTFYFLQNTTLLRDAAIRTIRAAHSHRGAVEGSGGHWSLNSGVRRSTSRGYFAL